jgi:hypothetical protein
MLVLVAIPAAIVILGMTALLRARREDIPDVARAIGRWLRG